MPAHHFILSVSNNMNEQPVLSAVAQHVIEYLTNKNVKPKMNSAEITCIVLQWDFIKKVYTFFSSGIILFEC